jgi:trans-AT polyketide synthase, acyltransferase and oxidoreductase domains
MNTNRLALSGDPARKVDFQIHCGPAMGAFNQFVKGTPFENWRNRHVDDIAELLMCGAARVLGQRYSRMLRVCASEAAGAGRL